MSSRLSALAIGAVITGIATSRLLRWAWDLAPVIEGRRHHLLGDDAMISLRYAYHLTRGQGLVWNPGDYVQGITNLGWTLVMAAIRLGLSLATWPFAVKVVNITLQTALVWLIVVWCCKRRCYVQGAVAGSLVALNTAMTSWGLSGFETTAESLLITMSVLSMLSDDHHSFALAPVWAALAVVIRPDALLIFLGVVAIQLLEHGQHRRLRAGIAVGVGIVVALFAFQRFYYGDWLPNTFALKATGGAGTITRGLAYLGRYATGEDPVGNSVLLLVAPLLNVAWNAWMNGTKAACDALRLAVLPIIWTAYVVLIGGDAFPHGRFFVPIVPLLALNVGALAEAVLRRVNDKPPLRQSVVAAGVGVVVLVATGASLERAWDLGPQTPVLAGQSPYMACLAVALNRSPLPRDAVIATYAVGTLAYYMPRYRFHDFLGKSDRVIAHARARHGPPGHNKWDYPYSLGQVRPSLIISLTTFGDAPDEVWRSGVAGDYGFHPALWLDPVFRSEYRPNQVRVMHDGHVVTAENALYARAGQRFDSITLPPGICRSLTR